MFQSFTNFSYFHKQNNFIELDVESQTRVSSPALRCGSWVATSTSFISSLKCIRFRIATFAYFSIIFQLCLLRFSSQRIVNLALQHLHICGS
ncbi:hypothetical protein LINPERPRIM_LOCUS33922 [Linum perenne]